MMVGSVVRQIDHLYVALDDAEAAFAFLTEVLLLPKAWPYSEYGVFASGGVCLGNVNLEVLRANDMPSQRAQHPARVTGIAFEPAGEIDDAVAVLDSHGIAHTPPTPFVVPGGTSPAWTNVGLQVTEGTFICKYHFDNAALRRLLREQLEARSGGPLGIVAVDEVVFGVSEPIDSAVRWTRLLGPSQMPDGHMWNLGAGPAVRLIPGAVDRVEHLVVRVRSLADAEAAARRFGVGVRASGDGLVVSLDKLGGLVFNLRA